MINVKVDYRALQRKAARGAREMMVGLKDEVRTMGRVYAATIAKWSSPYGSYPERPSQNMAIVRSDIRRTQVHMDELGEMWQQMKKIDEEKAKLIWHAMKKGKRTLQRKLLMEFAAMAGFTTGGVSRDAHFRGRGNQYGPVYPDYEPKHIITSGSVKQLEAYIKRRQKAIGRAKAGWAAAAKALGGAVSKREGFQTWYNTGQHKQAEGAARMRVRNQTEIILILHNKVPWSGGALSETRKEAADLELLDRYDDAIEKAAKYRFKKAMT